MSWYSDGTVSGLTASKIVTGVGTLFNARVFAGDLFTVDYARFYEVASVESATQLTLVDFPAANFTAVGSYSIIPLGLMNLSTTDLANRIAQLLTKWQGRETEYANWSAGTITGGDGAGKYPLTDALGNTTYVACPAKQKELLEANTLKDAVSGLYRAASTAPVASQIPVLDANKSLVLPTVGFLKGNFSSTAVLNRTLFQSSTANGVTTLTTIPNGSGAASGVEMWNSATAANCSALDMSITGAGAIIDSKAVGSGTVQPLILKMNGTEAARINTSGNMAIGGAGASAYALSVAKTMAVADSSGIDLVVTQSTAGSVTYGANLGSYSSHTTGTIANQIGVRGLAKANGAGGSVTTLIGVLSQVAAIGTPNVTSAIGLQISEIAIAGAIIKGIDSNISTGTNKWNIYAGGTAHSYHSGNFLVGRTADETAPKLQVGFANPVASPAYTGSVDVAVFNASGASVVHIQAPTASGLGFSSDTVRSAGYIGYTHATNTMEFRTSGTGKVYLTSAGNFLAGTTTENTTTGNAKVQSSNGIYLGNSANSAANVLDWYEEATFTATATGMTTAPTGTVSFTRVGNVVTLNLPAISGTSNATTFTLTGGPTSMRPATQKAVMVRVQDNSGAISFALATIETTGVITLYKDAAGTAFTGTGTKAVAAISLSYTIV